MASRAAIFTGMYPHNTGVYSFHDWSQHRNWVHDLNEAGYWCASVGKMHLESRGTDDGFHERIKVENPSNLQRKSGGADDDWGRFLAHHGIERPNHRNQVDPAWMQKYQGVPWHLEERFHSDVFIGDAAVGWIESWRGDRALFLEVGFTGPHEPWDPLPRHLKMYRDKEMRRHYYAKITTVDEQLGKVLDALERKSLLDNTLLILTSDHREMLGDHRMPYKWLMYDAVINVPLVVCDFRAGSHRRVARTDDLVSLMDLAPTIVEAAGIGVPTHIEGQSLAPYLSGEKLAPRQWVCCEDNYEIMMRGKDHKMVYYIGEQMGELYDLKTTRTNSTICGIAKSTSRRRPRCACGCWNGWRPAPIGMAATARRGEHTTICAGHGQMIRA